jgi:hypothetical protein
LRLDLEAGVVLGDSKSSFQAWVTRVALIGCSLAIAEMKCLLREVYSRFRTRVAADMRVNMELSDQVISSRPLDQTCKLVFERRPS